MIILILLIIMALGGCKMIYDNYRIRRYKEEKLWERVERHEAKKKKGAE